MKQVSFNVDITSDHLNWTDIEQIYDLIDATLRGKNLYTNEYHITTVIS